MNLKKTAFRVGIEHIISGAAVSVLYRSWPRGSNPLDFIPEPAPAETEFRVGVEAVPVKISAAVSLLTSVVIITAAG